MWEDFFNTDPVIFFSFHVAFVEFSSCKYPDRSAHAISLSAAISGTIHA
jgi:hypothetical protein